MGEYTINIACTILSYIMAVLCANMYILLHHIDLYYIGWMFTLLGICILIFGSTMFYESRYKNSPLYYWLIDICIGTAIIHIVSIFVTITLFTKVQP